MTALRWRASSRISPWILVVVSVACMVSRDGWLDGGRVRIPPLDIANGRLEYSVNGSLHQQGARMKLRAFVPILIGCVVTAPAARAPRFERVHELPPSQGVFAYSRISPDGRYLAYAAESREGARGRLARTITVVDLQTRKILFTEPGID